MPRPVFQKSCRKPYRQDFKAPYMRRHEDDRTTTGDRLTDHGRGLRSNMHAPEHRLGRSVPNPNAFHGLTAGIPPNSFMQMRIVISGQLQIFHGSSPGGRGQLEGHAPDSRTHKLQKRRGSLEKSFSNQSMSCLSREVVQIVDFIGFVPCLDTSLCTNTNPSLRPRTWSTTH